MNADSHAAAASVPVRFANGEEYQASPLSDKDLEELNEYIRAQYIRNVRNSLDASVTPEHYEIEMGIAHRMAAQLQFTDKVGASMMATPYNLARLLWQAVKKNHPAVSLDHLRSCMFDPKNIEEARIAFAKLNDAELESDVRKKGGESPTGKKLIRAKRKLKRRAVRRNRR